MVGIVRDFRVCGGPLWLCTNLVVRTFVRNGLAQRHAAPVSVHDLLMYCFLAVHVRRSCPIIAILATVRVKLFHFYPLAGTVHAKN